MGKAGQRGVPVVGSGKQPVAGVAMKRGKNTSCETTAAPQKKQQPTKQNEHTAKSDQPQPQQPPKKKKKGSEIDDIFGLGTSAPADADEAGTSTGDGGAVGNAGHMTDELKGIAERIKMAREAKVSSRPPLSCRIIINLLPCAQENPWCRPSYLFRSVAIHYAGNARAYMLSTMRAFCVHVLAPW